MAIWENLGKKVSGTTATAVQQAKVLTETTKLNAMIAEEKKNIENLYYQIGKRYAAVHHDDFEEKLADLMTGVIGSEKKIEAYQTQIQEIKGLTTCTNCGAQLQQDAVFCSVCGTPVPKKEEPAPSGDVCPKCGSAIVPGMRFCTGCGAALAEKKPEPVAAPAAPAPVAAAPAEPEEKTVVSARTCANCGAKLESDTVFCTECGSRAW